MHLIRPWASITSSMAISVGAGLRPDNAPPRLIDQHAVDDRLHVAELGGDLLPQATVVAQGLGLDATYDLLGSFHQRIQILVGPDVEIAEPVKEFGEVGDGRIPEDLALAVSRGAEPFGQMFDELAKFGDKRLLRQTDRLL